MRPRVGSPESEGALERLKMLFTRQFRAATVSERVVEL
jgi:hypothetical protein